MNIRQLQVTFLSDHDRLLARINTQDGAQLRFWLTRRLVQRLWPGLVQVTETITLGNPSTGRPSAAVVGDARGMMTEMARESALSQADFSTPFEGEATSLPLGEEPLLITRVDLIPQAGGQLCLALRQDETRGLEINMSDQLMHAFCTLIQKEVEKAGWGFKLDWADEAPAAGASRSLN